MIEVKQPGIASRFTDIQKRLDGYQKELEVSTKKLLEYEKVVNELKFSINQQVKRMDDVEHVINS